MAPETENALTWPLPRRLVTIFGREIPVELAAVAGVYALSGVWLFWQMWGLFPDLPQVVPGLFSSQDFVYAITYLVVFVVATVLFLVVALLGVAVFLLRADPVGRGLSVVVFLTLLAALGGLSLGSNGWFVVILLVAGACCATLFISPWCREVFAGQASHGGQPPFLVLSRTLLLGFFALLAFEVVVMLPGLRFVGALGPHFVVATLILVAACVVAWPAQRRMVAQPEPAARVLVTVAAGLALLGSLLMGAGFPWVQALLLAGIVAPLWLAKGAGPWFAGVRATGEKPA